MTSTKNDGADFLCVECGKAQHAHMARLDGACEAYTPLIAASAKNDGGPAFPCIEKEYHKGGLVGEYSSPGMSKREAMATMVLAGIVRSGGRLTAWNYAQENAPHPPSGDLPQMYASEAVHYADALIAELGRASPLTNPLPAGHTPNNGQEEGEA